MPRDDRRGGRGRSGGGRGAGSGGRMGGNRPRSGPGGNCLCPKCGESVPHERGTPCYSVQCPKCGTPMVKE